MLGRIARHLKISVSAIMDGITQEQADQITELTIQECDVELLKHFKKLKKLKIKPNLRDMGITLDLDISNMGKLESLDIIATDGITNINIDNAPNLNAINISGNKGLEKTTGLEDLKELKTLLMVDNNVLKEIPDIQSIAHGQNIETLQVDFDWLHLFEEKYGSLDKIQDDDVMNNKVTLIEKMGRFIYPLELDKGIEVEKKSRKILDQIIDDSMSETEKICAINTWLVDNVKYDFNVIDERDDASAGKIELEGQRAIDNIRANSAYNSLVLQSAVCEGYTNGMKYLLNKAGIEAEKVDCRYWDEEDEEITDYIHPKNSNHSIIRFKTKDGWFYSDPTFDSMDASKRKFFFKTRDEINKVHSLSIVEMNVDSPEVRPEEYSNERLSKILTEQLRRNREKEKQVSKDDKKEYKEHPETKNRPDDNPENWRKSFRFNIPQEQYQEVLEINQQMEEKFEQGEIESPEEKVEPTEHGVK